MRERPTKRAREDDDDDDDEQFLVREPGTSRHGVTLSARVCAAMNALEAAAGTDNQAAPETRPKVYFASRTHSQLAQLAGELKKTRFSKGSDPVRSVSLASRRHTCINPTVQRIGADSGVEAMNERCVEMADGRRARCEFMETASFDAFRDHTLVRCC